jgi:putative heme-binding domain-containing protein
MIYRQYTLGLILASIAAMGSTALAADFPMEKPRADWIWDATGTSSSKPIYLQKQFNVTGKVSSATLYSVCDNTVTVWVNGKLVGESGEWSTPIQKDVAKNLVPGVNTIAVKAANQGGPAGFTLKLVVKQQNTADLTILSDKQWKMTSTLPNGTWTGKDYDASKWAGKLVKVGTMGDSPWGVPGKKGRGQSTVNSSPETVDDFAVELVYEVPKDTQGSWVSLTTGPDGKLIACDQGGKGAFWIQVNESDDGPSATVSPLAVNRPGTNSRLSGAQGLLWAYGALWFHQNGGHLYRVTDSNGDGVLDQVDQVPSQRGGGEHGNHAVIKTEDNQGIYMAGGNHAPLAELSRRRVRSWEEDLLLTRMWDANGHARGKLAPGGWVTRLNPETLEQELVCIGFRNQYDISLNRFGDMFTYDADMEWDMGSPWYRPTRICQVVSGADYGWRSGTGKWPTYFEDSLPPVVEIGPGSPTGVVSGVGAAFPAKYQDALFALDWTFGTIYAIHMTPTGAGYQGTSEPFVTGSPLPVTDAVVGQDGLLYFTVGGRGAASGLYRVRYTGKQSTSKADSELPPAVAKARNARRRLETYHGVSLNEQDSKAALDDAWPYLSSEDRFLRNAARVAVESQPVQFWADRVLKEDDPQAFITSAIALARVGADSEINISLQLLLLNELVKAKVESDSQLLGLLRAVSLTCMRLGAPEREQRAALLERFDGMLPHSNPDVNTELIRLLVYLRSPTVAAKAIQLIVDREPPVIPDWTELAGRNGGYGGTVKRILENHPPSREIGYALALRNLRTGWTIEDRRAFFEFLNEAGKASGGSSFPGFMRNIRDEALANCLDSERIALQDLTGENYDPVPDFEIKKLAGPGREWTLAEAKSKATGFKKASFENGRSVYFAANCGKCHRHNGLGGNVGPDLTSIPNKFDVNYVIDHIIDPSKVISDQYQASTVLTADGRTLSGLVSEADEALIIYPSDPKAESITLAIEDVEAVRPSDVSQMPKGLIDGLNAEELRDLLAYLMSGGNSENKKIYGK